MRADSYFAGSRISLGWLPHFAQKDSLKKMATEGVASRKVLVKFARWWREVAWEALLLLPIPQLHVGGPGVIVQVDESKFKHKSKVRPQEAPLESHI